MLEEKECGGGQVSIRPKVAQPGCEITSQYRRSCLEAQGIAPSPRRLSEDCVCHGAVSSASRSEDRAGSEEGSEPGAGHALPSGSGQREAGPPQQRGRSHEGNQ